MKKIALFGSFGEGNIGDEAICLSTINNIQEIHKDCEIILFTHDVDDSKKRYKDIKNIIFRPIIATGIRSLLKQLRSHDFKQSINLIKECELVVIGGGGLFYDSEVDTGINPIFVWLLRVWLLKIYGSKIVVNAIGVGPIKSYSSKIFLKLIGNSVDKITVRDKYSLDLLKSCGVYTPIILSADPVWNTKFNERSMQDISKNPVLKYDARNKFGIQIRKVKGIKESRLIEMLATLIDTLVDKYLFSIVLIPMSYRHTKDVLLLEKIQVKSRHESKIEIATPKNIHELSDIIQECDVLLLSRLHSIITATMLGIPFLALSYSPKTDDLLSRLKINEFSWPINEAEITTIERMYLSLMKRKVTIRKHLKDMSSYMANEELKNKELFR